MIASFHIVHCKNRSAFESKKPGEGIAGLRFWKPLSIGPDFNALPKDFNGWDVAKPNNPLEEFLQDRPTVDIQPNRSDNS